MYDAVFQIFQSSSSLELTIASFHLLMELGKQYPRVYLTNSGSHPTLVIVKESWSPFLLGNNVASGELGRNTSRSDHLFDSLRFSLLTEAMVEASNDTGANNGLKHIENMVLFQYLVRTLEADFVPRHIAYKESLDWVIIRESVLSVLLGSRKLVFKMFVKNCISLLNQHQREVEDDISSKSASDLDSSLTFSLLEFEREALISVKKLFIMVINLDLIRKEADKLGLTSRADGLSQWLLQNDAPRRANDTAGVIIVRSGRPRSRVSPGTSQLGLPLNATQPRRAHHLPMLTEGDTSMKMTTPRASLPPNPEGFGFSPRYYVSVLGLHVVLQAFTEWKWKLQIILLYFSRYQVKSAVRTRRSDNSQQDLTVESALSMFSSEASAKAMVKMMCPEVAQLLLAHAYQISVIHVPTLMFFCCSDILPFTAIYILGYNFDNHKTFQVCLSVDGDSSEANDAAKMMGASLLEISCKFVLAFQNLRKINTNIQISQFEKEALFTAATLTRKLQNG
ncbi:unnamed protein product [Triticum turgidum subsp. durum]|uniref:Uncharacterized protein n=1 Tax=Triticum turgidum subsp. durum TaxID=4567 RepID=A0A9R0Y1E1_TRITD|nr:unnamed protein product [Triticum turgidum subsp. durum]